MAILLMFFAGFLNSIMDKIAFNFKKSIFSNLNRKYWDVSVSWKRQYKDGLVPTRNSWYYLGLYKPRYEERFPYSTTLLVWLTDVWHFAKAMMLLCFVVAILSYNQIFFHLVDGIIFYCVFTLTFTYSYEFILDRKIFIYLEQIKKYFIKKLKLFKTK